MLVKDAPAFVVNRLLTRFLGEVTERHRRGHPGRGRRRARSSRWACRCRRSCCCELVGPAVAPARLGDAARARSPTGSRVSENLAAAGRGGQARRSTSTTGQPDAGPGGRRAARAGRHRRSTEEQVRDRALDALAAGDRPDARRGRRRRGAGHRPVPDLGRRLAVPPGRHHAVPGPRPASPSGSPASGSCRRAWRRCPRNVAQFAGSQSSVGWDPGAVSGDAVQAMLCSGDEEARERGMRGPDQQRHAGGEE